MKLFMMSMKIPRENTKKKKKYHENTAKIPRKIPRKYRENTTRKYHENTTRKYHENTTRNKLSVKSRSRCSSSYMIIMLCCNHSPEMSRPPPVRGDPKFQAFHRRLPRVVAFEPCSSYKCSDWEN